MNLYSIVKLLSFVLHTVLGLYALRKGPRLRLNQAFCLAVLSIAVMEFGYFMLLVGQGRVLWTRIALIGQCLVPVNVVLLSLIYGRENYRDSLRTGKFYLITIYFISLVFLIAALSGILGVELSDEQTGYGLILNRASLFFVAFLLICTLIALINLENTYRQARQGRKHVKYPTIVFIAMLSFHLLIYSLALGFSYMRMDILIVGSITLIAANMCIAYPVIRPEPEGSRIYVGRAVIAKSYTLLLAGIYLLIIGMLGKIVQVIGKNLNFFLAFLAAFFVLLVLMAVILSKSLKHRFQSFIERNFYRSRYDYRREWENFSRRVFSASVGLSMKELLREVLDTVSETTRSANVSIMLLDERKGEFIAVASENRKSFQPPFSKAEEEEAYITIPADDEFLDWLWRYGRPVQMGSEGARGRGGEYPLTRSHAPSLPLPQNGVFVPIITEHKLIAIMILDQRETAPYSQEDMDLLETMANQISIAIMNARKSQELASSRELESLYKLSAMLLHDLKSSASMLSLVIQNAADNFGNPEFQKDALSTMSNVVDRIQKLILKLSTAPRKTEIGATHVSPLQPADLNEIVSGAVARSGVRDLAGIKVVEELSPVPELMADRENMERVILNLILNAIEAIEGEGVVTIKTCEERTQDIRHETSDIRQETGDGRPEVSSLKSQVSYAVVSVSDTGCGMSQEFIRDRLFQPFQTTKDRGLGLGLYQCKAIIDACGGVIEVQSRQGVGSIFKVKLPIVGSPSPRKERQITHEGLQGEIIAPSTLHSDRGGKE